MTIYLARVERHVDTTRVEAFSRRIRLAASRPCTRRTMTRADAWRRSAPPDLPHP